MRIGPKLYLKVWMATRYRTYELPKDHIIRRTWVDKEMGNAVSRNHSGVAEFVNAVGRNLWNDSMIWEVNWDF